MDSLIIDSREACSACKKEKALISAAWPGQGRLLYCYSCFRTLITVADKLGLQWQGLHPEVVGKGAHDAVA